jgi:hypothetical protein
MENAFKHVAMRHAFKHGEWGDARPKMGKSLNNCSRVNATPNGMPGIAWLVGYLVAIANRM